MTSDGDIDTWHCIVTCHTRDRNIFIFLDTSPSERDLIEK